METQIILKKLDKITELLEEIAGYSALDPECNCSYNSSWHICPVHGWCESSVPK